MTAIPAPNKKKTTLVSWINQENVAGYMFSLPFIFGFLMFMVIPMGLSLFYSFCKYDIPMILTYSKDLILIIDNLFRPASKECECLYMSLNKICRCPWPVLP